MATAVDSDLKAIAEQDKDLANSALAATARVLARELDSAKNSATSKSMCARALAETLGQLRALIPDRPEGDKVDELTDRRARRRAGRATA